MDHSTNLKLDHTEPGLTGYARNAIWLKSHHPTIFRMLQFVKWSLSFVLRRIAPIAILAGLIAFAIFAPSVWQELTPYRTYFQIAAGLLGVIGLLTVAAAVVNAIVRRISEAEYAARQSMKAAIDWQFRQKDARIANQLRDVETRIGAKITPLMDKRQKEFENKIREMTTTLQHDWRQQADQQFAKLHNDMGAFEELREHLDTEVDKMQSLVDGQLADSRDETASANEQIERLRSGAESVDEKIARLPDNMGAIEELRERLDTEVDKMQSHVDGQLAEFHGETASANEKIKRLCTESESVDKLRQHLDHLPFMNFPNVQVFNRALRPEHVSELLEKYGRTLDLHETQTSLYYKAHRICSLEARLTGRLATSIENAVLRTLIATAPKVTNLQVLEIGTLFGVGLAMIHDLAKHRFESVHVTAIDPLTGYYSKAGEGRFRDITGQPVTLSTFRQNMAEAGVPETDCTLIQSCSTNDSAVEAAAKNSYDLLIIDGDHSFSGVANDFNGYAQFVKPGGFIIFDDYDAPNWPDVKRFVDENVIGRPDLTLVGASWRTAVFRTIRPIGNHLAENGSAAEPGPGDS